MAQQKMEFTKVYQWLKENQSRRKILTAATQPMTAKQLSRKTGIPPDTCSHTLRKFTSKGQAVCLNPKSRTSRLYQLTELGIRCQKQVYQDSNHPYKEYNLPDIDWQLYGWVCFNHRCSVIKTLITPLQPSEIKRILRVHRPNIKISANNIRDIIKLFLAKAIVRPVKLRKKAHLRYELTELGDQFRQLLVRV